MRSSAPRTSGARRPCTPAGNAEETAIRSAPGSARAESANGRAGSGSGAASPGIGPRTASSTIAVSITERVSAP